MRPAVLIGDQGGGLAAAFAILAAVLCAPPHGRGRPHRRLDRGPAGNVGGPPRAGGRATGAAGGAGRSPARDGTFRTADGGWVVLGVYSEDRLWDVLCEELGLDWYVGLTMAERAARSEDLHARLAWELSLLPRDEAVRRLSRERFPSRPCSLG